jgi:hypothetical protein
LCLLMFEIRVLSICLKSEILIKLITFSACDPTIVKDPNRTSATVSLSDLQGLQKNFLSNHVV